MLFRLTTCNLYVAIQKGLFPIFFYLRQKISTQHQPCTQFVQPLGVFCQFGKIAMQMRKNFVCNVCRVREKNHKFLHNVSRVRNLCNRWVSFVSIWQNCNADAQKFCLQCLPCKRKKPQISHNVSRVRNSCNRWVFFVSIWQNCNADAEKFCLQCLQCKREKPQNPPFMAFICVKSTHLTVNMV